MPGAVPSALQMSRTVTLTGADLSTASTVGSAPAPTLQVRPLRASEDWGRSFHLPDQILHPLVSPLYFLKKYRRQINIHF